MPLALFKMCKSKNAVLSNQNRLNKMNFLKKDSSKVHTYFI